MVDKGKLFVKYLILVIVSTLNQVYASKEAILSKLHNDVIHNQLECINLVIEDYQWKFTTVGFDYLGVYDPLLFKLSSNRQVLRLNINHKVHFDERESVKRVILIVHDISILEDFLTKWYKSKHFNENCKLFIMFHGNNHPNDVMRLTSQIFMYRVVVIDEWMNIYVPEPMSPRNCNMTTMKMLPMCDGYAANYIKQLGVEKFVNFHSCPVVVLTREYRPYINNVKDENDLGLEAKMVKRFSNLLNFTIRYYEHNSTQFGVVLENGTHTHLYKALKDGAGNVLIGIVSPQKYGDFSRTKLYLYTDYRVYIPKSAEVPHWANLIYVFTPVTWCGFIVSTCLFQIFYYFFQRLIIRTIKSQCGNNITTYQSELQNISHSFLDIFGVTIAQSVPQPKITIKRILFMSWALVAFIFSCGYETKLLSFLMKSIHEKQIKTYEDMAKSTLEISGNSYAKSAFSESYGDPYVAEIYNRWANINNAATDDLINGIANNRTLIVVSNQLRMTYLLKDTHLKNHIYVSAPIMNFYSYMLLQKGHPLRTGFDNLISRFEESGLFKEDIVATFKTDYRDVYQSDLKSLQIAHVLGAFIIYFMGICLGIIMFIIERSF